MARTGRPRKPINKEQFQKLCNIHCTEQEIAAFFEVSTDTLCRWCKAEYKTTFADIYNIYKAKGKIALRRFQFQHAEKSPYMARWLGERLLGQREAEPEKDDDEAIVKLLERLEERDMQNAG